jgi:hypothetical protein
VFEGSIQFIGFIAVLEGVNTAYSRCPAIESILAMAREEGKGVFSRVFEACSRPSVSTMEG